MSFLQIAEVFGHSTDDVSSVAASDRLNRQCPFRGSNCTKSSTTDPLGICSLSDGGHATAICPVRFVENNRIFTDAARIAFGQGLRFVPVPEVKILRVSGGRKIGKIDYVLAQLDDEDAPIDFAALEVQAVYFSGRSIRPAMNYFLSHGQLDPTISQRRPDYRSSAQKRLMPQLSLKVPVFRRWGKKFCVAVDSLFFAALPPMRTVAASNSELTWLVYPIAKRGNIYTLDPPQVSYCQWDDVLDALREGESPEPAEIVEELAQRMRPERILTT